MGTVVCLFVVSRVCVRARACVVFGVAGMLRGAFFCGVSGVRVVAGEEA